MLISMVLMVPYYKPWQYLKHFILNHQIWQHIVLLMSLLKWQKNLKKQAVTKPGKSVGLLMCSTLSAPKQTQ